MTSTAATAETSAPAAAVNPWDGHPFAHLGPGPYRLIGVQTTEDREEHNARLQAEGKPYTTNMCGGTCDHCGMAIWDVYIFRAANGATFKVGCDCEEKAEHTTAELARAAHEAGNYRAHAALTKWAEVGRKARLEVARKKRHAREQRKADEARAWIAANEAALAARPHPKKWAADKGETLLDSLRWYEAKAGQAKFAQVVAAARKALEADTA